MLPGAHYTGGSKIATPAELHYYAKTVDSDKLSTLGYNDFQTRLMQEYKQDYETWLENRPNYEHASSSSSSSQYKQRPYGGNRAGKDNEEASNKNTMAEQRQPSMVLDESTSSSSSSTMQPRYDNYNHDNDRMQYSNSTPYRRGNASYHDNSSYRSFRGGGPGAMRTSYFQPSSYYNNNIDKNNYGKESGWQPSYSAYHGGGNEDREGYGTKYNNRGYGRGYGRGNDRWNNTYKPKYTYDNDDLHDDDDS